VIPPFSNTFPEFFNIFKQIGFVFQDTNRREITTFVFGNYRLTTEKLLSKHHLLSNPQYLIQGKEYADLVLQQFISLINFFFFRLHNSKIFDVLLLSSKEKGYFSGFHALSDIKLEKMLHSFFSSFNPRNVPYYFKSFDDTDFYCYLKDFLK